MTLLELLITAVVAGVAAFLGTYLKKKGENLATHEDIAQLVDQVSAVTEAAKLIESKISVGMWRRERKAELQLKAIDSVNVMTSQFIQSVIEEANYRPSLEWYSAFSATDAVVKALFTENTYVAYKNVEKRIGPGLGSNSGATTAVLEFVDARGAAVKAMYTEVIG